jgi:GNAT superfamily N-acetyltransferase
MTPREVTGVEVRPATAADLATVSAIEAAAFSDPWSPEAFEALLGKPQVAWTVAVTADGTVVGYCILLLAGGEGDVANIATAPGWRGRGVAHLLLAEACRLDSGAARRSSWRCARGTPPLGHSTPAMDSNRWGGAAPTIATPLRMPWSCAGLWPTRGPLPPSPPRTRRRRCRDPAGNAAVWRLGPAILAFRRPHHPSSSEEVP